MIFVWGEHDNYYTMETSCNDFCVCANIRGGQRITWGSQFSSSTMEMELRSADLVASDFIHRAVCLACQFEFLGDVLQSMVSTFLIPQTG